MKIVKIPITEQNKKVYWSKNKNSNAWEKLVSECPSMTSEEFWNNELEEYDKGEMYWYFIIGKPESIIDELINLKIGDTDISYPYIKENRPALYVFKIATAYFREQGLVPVFEDCHCKLMKL